MTLHLIKLSVGSDSFHDLEAWQKQRLKDMKRQGQKPELIHVTRQTPKRADEILDGGSIYWVVKGVIVARQKMIELRPMMKEGVPHCGLVHDKELIHVRWQPRRAFQGWRYLDPKEAPPDVSRAYDISDLPDDLRHELAALGFL